MKKRQYLEDFQRYHKYQIKEVGSVSLHKRCNNKVTKFGVKERVRTDAKAPTSGYRLYLKKQLNKMIFW